MNARKVQNKQLGASGKDLSVYLLAHAACGMMINLAGQGGYEAISVFSDFYFVLHFFASFAFLVDFSIDETRKMSYSGGDKNLFCKVKPPCNVVFYFTFSFLIGGLGYVSDTTLGVAHRCTYLCDKFV